MIGCFSTTYSIFQVVNTEGMREMEKDHWNSTVIMVAGKIHW